MGLDERRGGFSRRLKIASHADGFGVTVPGEHGGCPSTGFRGGVSAGEAAGPIGALINTGRWSGRLFAPMFEDRQLEGTDTHDGSHPSLTGWCAGLAVAPAVGITTLSQALVFAATTAGYALLPDLDHPGARASKLLGPVTEGVVAV